MVSVAPPIARPKAGAEEKIYTASQWQLMRWRLLKHKLAVVSLALLACFYIVAIFCEFIAPNDPLSQQARYHLSPPQKIHFVDETGFHLRPFVYGTKGQRHPVTLRMIHEEDRTVKHPIRFLQRGDKYRMWGMWETDLHLFGIEDQDARLLLFGADTLGRDMLSRIIYGARLSLSIGFVGVMLSLILGIVLGGISGYFGGTTDMIIQRIIELLQAVPSIPLWLTLAAAMPREWSNIQVYFAITVILAIRGWTGLARTVRGKFLALREEEFVLAAKFLGANEMRIILRHMVPSFTSHLIAVLTLNVPGMILAETSLSFLGLGLQAPVISWGVLLSGAQNIVAVAQAPWLFLPGVAIVVTVLCFNFAGDGLRDAADPYAQ
jgi:peptide/nickel transport system permease protein